MAAMELKISQPTITESIQALEAKAGVKLFKRASRGVSLTQEGFRFLSHARKILISISDAAQALKESGLNLKGTIRLGVSPVVAGYFLATPLAHFNSIYPDININIIEFQPNEMEELVADGTLDLAIMLLPSLSEPEGLEMHTIFSARRRLWLSPKHRLLSARNIRLADVAEEKYLLHTPDDNTQTTLRYWGRHGLKPSIHFATASIEAIRSLVAADVGVTILSDLVYRPWSLDGERIEARIIADELPELKIGIVWKKGAEFDACVNTFREFCIERVGADYMLRHIQNQRD